MTILIRNHTIEEFNGDLCVECELEFEITPGEPMVRYYADGSGYPGSPAEVELIAVYVDSITDIDGNDVMTDALVAEVNDHIFHNLEKFEDDALESINEGY